MTCCRDTGSVAAVKSKAEDDESSESRAQRNRETNIVQMPRVSPVRSNNRMTDSDVRPRLRAENPWGRLSKDQTLPSIRQGSDLDVNRSIGPTVEWPRLQE